MAHGRLLPASARFETRRFDTPQRSGCLVRPCSPRKGNHRGVVKPMECDDRPFLQYEQERVEKLKELGPREQRSPKGRRAVASELVDVGAYSVPEAV